MASFTQIAFDFDEQPVLPKKEKEKVKAKPKPQPVAEPELKQRSKRGRKSLKDMVSDAEMIRIPSDEVLKQKLYYSISEVSELFQLNASSLRYWETEFSHINPRKNKKGDRFYTAEDIKKLQLIYFLLRQRKYTIEGAKDYLKKYKDDSSVRFELVQSLQQMKAFLLQIKADL